MTRRKPCFSSRSHRRKIPAALFAWLIGVAVCSASIFDIGRGRKLEERVEQLRDADDYRAALPVAQELLALRERTHGPNHEDTSFALDRLASIHRKLGEFGKAEALYVRALAIDEKRHGTTDRRLLPGLAHLGRLYLDMRKFGEAKRLFERTLKIAEQAYGPEHLETADALDDLSDAHRELRDFSRAEQLELRALRIQEKQLGPSHPDLTMTLASLGKLYLAMDRLAQAETFYARALRIEEKAHGPEHLDTADAMDNLSRVCRRSGRLERAEELAVQALKIQEKQLRPDHPTLGPTLHNLASICLDRGQYARAEPLFLRDLKITKALRGPDHEGVISTLSSLGTLYALKGDYAKARQATEQALAICDRNKALDPVDVATCLGNMGAIRHLLGDMQGAVTLFERSIAMKEKELGLQNADLIQPLQNIASIYGSFGDWATAAEFSARAKALREKLLPATHPESLLMQLERADRDFDAGKRDEATATFRRVIAVQQKVLGKDHPEVARSHMRLAGHETDSAEARRLLSAAQTSIEKTLGPRHPSVAENLLAQAALHEKEGNAAVAERLLQRVLQIQEGAHGTGHHVTAASLEGLARSAITRDERKEALELTLRALAARETFAANVFSFATERQRLGFQDTVSPFDLVATLGDAPAIARTVLRWKGLVLDSMLEDRLLLGASPRRPRSLAGGQATPPRSRRALSIEPADLTPALANGVALVEFIRYQKLVRPGSTESHYGAVVMLNAQAPQWVPLGPSSSLSPLMGLYGRSVRGVTDETTLRRVSAQLHERIWQPIEGALHTGVRTVIISPDGLLNLISFGTLLAPDGTFLCEKRSLRYVSSGRDLLHSSSPAARKTLVIVANPDFRARTGTTSKNEPAATGSSTLAALAGTADEAAALERLGEQAQLRVQTFAGAAADEANVRKLMSPSILHIATHGFVFSVGRPDAQTRQRARSGLALAGAEYSLPKLRADRAPLDVMDGILTGEEVSTMDLRETWLVSLSGCDTGVGGVRGGEGVLGLRRGFIMAGVQNLLMTLWPISDQTTDQIMLNFYDRAFMSDNAPQALADVQREWLVKLRTERGLLAAVQLAGPFIMSSQGRQE